MTGPRGPIFPGGPAPGRYVYTSAPTVLRNVAQFVGVCVLIVGSVAIGYGAWVRMHFVAIDICGMAVDAGGRMTINLVGLLGMGASLVLGGASAAGLVYGARSQRWLGAAALLLLLVILGLMQWCCASVFDASCSAAPHLPAAGAVAHLRG